MTVRTEEGADPHGAWTAVVGLIMAAGVLVCIIGLQALFNKVQEDEIQRKIVDVENDELAGSVASQLENLNRYRWIDEANGRVTVPIERAMELIVRDEQAMGNP